MLSDKAVPKTRVIKRKSPESIIVAPPELTREDRRLKFHSMAEQVAQSQFFYRNRMCEPLRKAYPEYPRLWVIDQYFPQAQGGPLYVDTINRYWDSKVMEKQIEMHTLRAKIMKKAGFRYVFLLPGMTEEEALAQMKEE